MITLRLMREVQPAELRCKYCNSTDVVKAGTRRLKCGVKQLHKCNGCLRKFSNLHRNAKQTDPEIILKTLILVCRGYSYEQASRFVLRKYQTLISISVISKWVKEYNPPYLRRMLKDQQPIATPEPKAREADAESGGSEAAKNTKIHEKSDVASNVERASRSFASKRDACATFQSQIAFEPDLPVKHSQGTQASKDALKALQFAKTNFRRHDCVENFMLNCDCYTIATEVPVWMSAEEFGLATKERKERKKMDVSNCRDGMGNALPAETQDHNAAGRFRPSTVPLAITPAKLQIQPNPPLQPSPLFL